MAIIKLSSSKRAVQFVLTEDVEAGTVFQTSASLVAGVCGSGRINGDFVLLSRLPLKQDPGKYPVSEVWNPGGVELSRAVENSGSLDASSSSFVRERREQRVGRVANSFKPEW